MVDSKRRLFCMMTCVLVLLGTVLVLPRTASALATVVPEPYIFVPNGEGAELLLDSQENLYWLHIISGDVHFRKYNSSHDLVIPDTLLYGNGTNENVDAEWDDFGYIHFTWATDYFGAQSVMYSKIDKNGIFLVAPLKLSGDNTARDFSSAIATNSLGQAYVAWDYWWDLGDPLAEDVLYAKVDTDGTTIFSQLYVAPAGWDTEFYGKKDIVVDRSDNLHVFFDRVPSAFNIQIYYKKYDTDGTSVLISEKQLIPTTYSDYSSSMEAILDSQDRINLAYSCGFGSPTMMEVFYARIDLQGNLDFGPIMLSQDNDSHSHQAYLSVDGSDNSYVFWRETGDGNGEVYHAVVDENGIVTRDLTRLTDTVEDNGIYYMAAVIDSSDFCIWSYFNETGTFVVLPMGPPKTTITPGLPRYGVSPTYVTSATPFSLTVSDPNGTGILGTYYQVDSLPWVNYTQEGPFTIQGEGAHTISYNSTGGYGSPEPTNTYDIVVDDTAPTSSVVAGFPNYTIALNHWITSLTPISLTAVDGGPLPVGVNYSRCRTWNGGSWTLWNDYSTPFFIGLSEGISYVEHYSSDILWNSEEIVNTTFIVDNTPPTSAIHYDAAGMNLDTQFTLEADDGQGSGVAETLYSVDGGSWQAYAGGFSFDEYGQHIIAFRSTDFLGNSEPQRELTIDIPEPEREENLKPFLAVAFAIILLLCGLVVSRRRPIAFKSGTSFSKTFLVMSMPFWLAEIITGIISLITGLLSVPPLFGIGMLVDMGILLAGLIVLAVHGRGPDEPEDMETEETEIVSLAESA
jgi:hypothetical protein